MIALQAALKKKKGLAKLIIILNKKYYCTSTQDFPATFCPVD